jgi:hypothetical protein
MVCTSLELGPGSALLSLIVSRRKPFPIPPCPEGSLLHLIPSLSLICTCFTCILEIFFPSLVFAKMTFHVYFAKMVAEISCFLILLD